MSDKPWGIYVYCRRGGVTRDAGLHSSHESKEAAERELPHELAWLRKFYDEVTYEIRLHGGDE